jgi:hypothetical protein
VDKEPKVFSKANKEFPQSSVSSKFHHILITTVDVSSWTKICYRSFSGHWEGIISCSWTELKAFLVGNFKQLLLHLLQEIYQTILEKHFYDTLQETYKCSSAKNQGTYVYGRGSCGSGLKTWRPNKNLGRIDGAEGASEKSGRGTSYVPRAIRQWPRNIRMSFLVYPMDISRYAPNL